MVESDGTDPNDRSEVSESDSDVVPEALESDPELQEALESIPDERLEATESYPHEMSEAADLSSNVDSDHESIPLIQLEGSNVTVVNIDERTSGKLSNKYCIDKCQKPYIPL